MSEPEELKLWWKIRPATGGSWLIVPFNKLDEGLADMVQVGEELKIVAVRMTQKEVDALGDFDGW